MNEHWIDLLRLACAAAAGGLIGTERQVADKPAGLRTNILICLGAAVFTIVSARMAEASPPADHSRIAAQVITGVGFLGAGAVIHHRGSVSGLTTAATIWTVASIGMAFGAGLYFLGGASTIGAYLVLMVLRRLEGWLAALFTTAHFEVELSRHSDANKLLTDGVTTCKLSRHSWSVMKSAGGWLARISVSGPSRQIDDFQAQLLAMPDVLSLQRR